jgi:hypothetical protein
MDPSYHSTITTAPLNKTLANFYVRKKREEKEKEKKERGERSKSVKN